MKLHKTLLITALSLFAASGLMAKEKAKKEEIPGVAHQPAEFFYTGKPYDKDLGAYTFNYRNYDPKVARWTSADPSGFPDGANIQRYAPIPTIAFDATGLFAQSFSVTSSQGFSIDFVATYDSNSLTIAGATLGGTTGGSQNWLTYSDSWSISTPAAALNSSNLSNAGGTKKWNFSVLATAQVTNSDAWGITIDGYAYAFGQTNTTNHTWSSSGSFVTNAFE